VVGDCPTNFKQGDIMQTEIDEKIKADVIQQNFKALDSILKDDDNILIMEEEDA
jgi:hypothetical protein